MKQTKWTEAISTLGTSGMSREVRKLLKEIERQGDWRGRRTAKGHVFLVHKSGYTTTIASTPSDTRTLLNSIADVKRANALTGV